MRLNEKEIENIICNSVTENLICRALELRPGELAKFICGLANVNGGYILVGVEKDNGLLKPKGLQLAFDMKSIMNSVDKNLDGTCQFGYGYVNVSGKNIFVIKVERAKQKILVDNVYYCFQNNSVEVRQIEEAKRLSTLFISYTECDTPIVDIIEDKIREKLQDKIKVSRYTGLKYKDSFKEFMDTIQEHDYVLTVVSDTYLKRQACMYEVGEIIKDHHYKDKLLFVVLSENERKYYGENIPEKIGPNIYGGAEARLEYIGFWKEKFDKLQQMMSNIGDYEATSEATKDLKIIGQIYRKDMGEFLQFLSDENGKNFQKLYENDFKAINEQISNFAQTYPTNLKASSNEALLFMRRYRFANCSCFSCCFKDAYPSSNVQ